MMFSSPWWCCLAVLALMPWFGPWRGRDRVQNVLRSLLFLALAIALAKPHIIVEDSLQTRVLILDRSSSVSPEAQQLVLGDFDKLTDLGQTHLVIMGKAPVGTKLSGFQSVTEIALDSIQGSSPLSAALSRAAALIPRGVAGSITIAGDALATQADDDRAVTSLRQRRIPIHWLALPAIPRSPTPTRVVWNDPLRQGESCSLMTRIVSSQTGSDCRLVLKQKEDGQTLASTNFKSAPDQIVGMEFEPKSSGFIDAEMIVDTDDGKTVQSLSITLPVRERPKLLYLGERQSGGAEKLTEMIGSSFDVVSPKDMKIGSVESALLSSDLVMLDDIAADSLTIETERKLVRAVQEDGLGLVMSGGRAAFGAGGWHQRPIESLLPVELVQKEEKRDPSTSLVIVIDTSGSMTGVRVQLAKEVARLAMRRLLPHDKVGIVEFYGAKRWAAPLQPASNAIELQRALNRMDAGGGTVILPALEEAFYGLQNVDTRYKHVLVLTDGGVESGDFESLMRRMAGQGINVSTVLAGGGYHSEFLVNLASWGKGRFYNVPNRFNLPEILLKQPSTTKLPSYRPGVHELSVRSGPGWWGDIDTTLLPAINGYVESKPRIGSQVLLETAVEKHPILATWRYGLGRVTTFNTEPLGAGTEPWEQWPDYARSLTRILQRSAGDSRDPFRYEVTHDAGEVILSAIRQQSRGALETRPMAKLLPVDQRQLPPDSSSDGETLTFIRRSPDHYLCRRPAPRLGESLRIATSASTTPTRWQPLVAVSPVVFETQVDPDFSTKMARLVSVSGGEQFDVTQDWVKAPASTRQGQDLLAGGPWLFGFALLLFLAEVIWRRLPRRNTGGQAASGRSVSVGAAVTLVMAMLLGTGSGAHAETTLEDQVLRQANELIDASIGKGFDHEKVSRLFRSAVLSSGSTEPLIDWLRQERADFTLPRAQAVAELEVHLASRRGDLRRASELLDELLDAREIADRRQDLQLWQAKLHDALGQVVRAKEIYESLVKKDLSLQDQQAVRLRLALMGLIAAPGQKQVNDAKPLIELAKQSSDVPFRNRAAIVLALQNKYSEAISLFTIEGEGTERFRNASRIAEWAIRASNRDKAIETAWEAVESAELKRDRNYALTLLVEAYRMKKKKEGLEELVKKLNEKKEAGDSMSNETRTVWIALLRELGRYDDAIRLFKSTAGNNQGFTVDMRRELLEMEGEAGQEDRMIDSYRELVQAEPNELTWRSGLTQILLEKGNDEQAKALWDEFVKQTERGSVLLASAKTLGEFGLDDLAKQTIERMVDLRVNHGQALLYWSDLQQRRGRVDLAEAALNRIHAMDDVTDEVRSELAGAYEKLGRQDMAIEVNETIRAGRKTVAEDLEMRLAWLYSEVGDEEKALQQWLALWRKVTSIPRRRYIEDRLMTVASRLGTLADIAIELEEKLADGTADDREAGLLVRIYSRVNDSVAATEISDEYMSRTGKNEVEQLQEKGRIYQICNDYWNYEKVVERLIEVDPEGKTEYLRQLALSMLERGKAQEAREVLIALRDSDDGKDSIGGEFEAGVLSLVGLTTEAANAYRKGIATYPDRIESYLLLANLLKEMRQKELAVGMFQYLAENADRDDLFTIAIDGLLNMEAEPGVMQWARRITLERLAGREDKNYLYQLLADLSTEVNDRAGQIRALENSLAVAGTRRLSILRECMQLSSRIRGGVYYSSSQRGPTNKGNEAFFSYGRRLIGLRELMPPEVFLDLGKAFLDDGDTTGAERTFNMARNVADPRTYQREVASIFETSGKLAEALVRYDRLLRTSPSDVAMIAKVAVLNEQEGNEEAAFRFYRRGLNLLLSQTPLTTNEDSNAKGNTYWTINRDAYDTYSQQLLEGLLVTAPDESIEKLIDEQSGKLRDDLKELGVSGNSGRVAERLADAPRIEKRASVVRSMCFAFNDFDKLELINRSLIDQFRDDQDLPGQLAGGLLAYGRYDSVRRMLDLPLLNEQQKQEILTMLGENSSETGTSQLTPKEMWQRFLPEWIAGDDQAALRILRRVDQSKSRVPGVRPTYVIINGRAVPQTVGGGSGVLTWMRLASVLGDEGLALQFARARLQAGVRSQPNQIGQLFNTYREMLSEETFADLVRYAANIYKEDPQRLAEYLWLISTMSQYCQDVIPDDQKLLEMIEDSDLQLNYYFPSSFALEVFPEAIRAEAFAAMLDRMVDKYRPRELLSIAFVSRISIDDATKEVFLKSFESGIDPAIQDDYLRYCISSLPRSGQIIQRKENLDLALSMLNRLCADNVRKRAETVARTAEFVKAIVLSQSGRTEEALEIALKYYTENENSTDYYLKMMRDWAYRELIPAASERFLEHLTKDFGDGKPSVSQTDRILSLVKQTKDEKKIRDAYQKAIQDHPDQNQYVSLYDRWEQGQNRDSMVIKINESQLEKLEKTEQSSTQADAIRRRLGALWTSAMHPVNASKYLAYFDDLDRKAFESELKRRSGSKVKTDDKRGADNTDQPKRGDSRSENKSNSGKPAVEKTEKSYAVSMTGVQAAIKDENVPAARETLRKIWRVYPPAVASPYRYSTRTKQLNGITWPSNSPTGTTPPVTDDKERPATSPDDGKPGRGVSPTKVAEDAKLAARNAARKGLATFIPPVSNPKPPSPSAWKALADQPFAIGEMQRIIRSRSGPSIAAVQSVSLGLLEAERINRGDQASFNSLVELIQQEQISDEILVRLFAMLEDDFSLLNEDNRDVIDVLLKRLDLTDARRAEQLAELCGRAGQLNRSRALYRHCALLTTGGSGSFANLIKNVEELFQGNDLLALAESMYVLSKQSASEDVAILELREKLLKPEEAAQKSVEMFSKRSSNHTREHFRKTICAVPIFSRVGNYELAKQNLTYAMRQHGEVVSMSSNPYAYSYTGSSTRNLHRLSRQDLIRIFPAEAEGYDDYDAWLRHAAQSVIELRDQAKTEIRVETLLTIAFRQCQREQFDEASDTLSNISDSMIDDAKQFELLAIDVMRMAGQAGRALKLEQLMHADRRLTPWRFGDFLRDTADINGQQAAGELFDELVGLTMEDDFMEAAKEIAVGNQELVARVSSMQSEKEAAQTKQDERVKAAKNRSETRRKWRLEDSKNANNADEQTNAKNSAAAPVSSGIRRIRTIPGSRLTPARVAP